MEIIDRISEIEAGITSLQNPSFISQIFRFSGGQSICQAYSFCKWGALFLALLASLTTLLAKIRILVIRFQNQHAQPPSHLLNGDDFSDYDTDSDSSTQSDQENEDDEPSVSSSNGWRSCTEEDFTVRGSDHYFLDQWQNSNFRLRRRRNSIGDLFNWAGGKNVVKLWDDSTGSPSPAVAVSAEASMSGYLLRVWDTRVGSRIPEILAEWRPRLGQIVGVAAEKVYVRDDITGGLTVGDMRKAGSPLVELTESDMDTWWDADAVTVADH